MPGPMLRARVGDCLMVDHAIFRIHKGAAGAIHVEGEEAPDVFDPINSSDVP